MQLLLVLLILIAHFPAETLGRIRQVEIVRALPNGRCGEADLAVGRLSVSLSCPAISEAINPLY